METYPPGPEQQVALDGLRAGLGLTPMDDPYGYIKEVQSDFDYGKIPYSKEYYELMPEPEPAGPPERPDWKVYFDNGFGSHHTGHDKPGKELSVNQTFTWGGKVWHIPAVYVCGKGLVVDLCMEVDPAELQSFMEKWWPHGEEEGREFTPEEQERQNAENPSNMDFTPRLTVNSRELGGWSGNGCGWVPDSCRPESERWQSRQNWEAIWLMEHYGFDPEQGWMFWRYSFPWATKTRPVLKAVPLSLEQNPVSVPGIRFTVSGAGDSVPFIHPVTGEMHTLRVVEYETQQMDANHFHDKEQWEYPTCYTAMSFTVEPELPRQSLTVRDSGQGDRPRLKQPDMVGPTAASSVGIILANSKNSQTWTACSSLYFAWPERIEWRMVFRQKTVKDIKLDLPLTQK